MNKYLGEKGQISQRENSKRYKKIVNLQEGELNLKCLLDLVICIQRIGYTKLNLSSELPLAEAGCKSQGYQVMTVLPLTLSNNLLMQGMI